MFERLKAKWGLKSNFQVIRICLVFSLAGSSIGFIRHIVWALFGFTAETSAWIKVPTYIAFIFPTYQTMLLVFGILFGEFRFFWDKEKKMFRALGRLLGLGKKEEDSQAEKTGESTAPEGPLNPNV